MVEIPPIVSVILGIITLLSGGASAVAILRSNLLKSSVEVLRKNNEDLKERVAILEAETEEYERAKLADSVKMEALARENDTLRSVVTGATAIKELTERIEKVDTRRTHEHADTMAAVQMLMTIINTKAESPT